MGEPMTAGDMNPSLTHAAGGGASPWDWGVDSYLTPYVCSGQSYLDASLMLHMSACGDERCPLAMTPSNYFSLPIARVECQQGTLVECQLGFRVGVRGLLLNVS